MTTEGPQHGGPPAHRPLAGVDVVDLSRYLPGPYCTLQLAQLGASVVTVEQPPMGDPMRQMPPLGPHGESLASAALHAGKQQLLADLRDDDDRERVLERIAAADVVVEGFRPGVAERLGVGPVTVRRRCRAVVYCSLTGYGQTGPWAQNAGHDANYEAAVGLLDRSGTADAPLLPPLPLADLAGGMAAATAICAALVRRERSGEGCHIDISLTEAALALQQHVMPAAHTLEGQRGHGLLNGGLACYGVYRCADDRWLAVAPIEPKFFVRLCSLLDCDDVAPLQYDLTRQHEVREALAQRLSTRTADAWHELLATEETCVSKVLTMQEARTHPQLSARNALQPLDVQGAAAADVDAAAAHLVPAAPYVFDGSRSGQR